MKSILNRSYLFVGALAAATVLLTSGCTTKNYVRSQTAPLVQKTNELDDATAANNRAIQKVNEQAQQGIQQAQQSANTASQKAAAASSAAQQAQSSAEDAIHQADSLSSVVSNLDSYKQVGDVTVHFGFDKSVLTRKDREKLGDFAAQLATTKNYILEVTGGTDSTGSEQYNYQLSQRRARAVVQYLASEFNIPPHKFYLIGIGKDVEVANNRTAAGRARNRRVKVQLLTNTVTSEPTSASVSSVQQ